ncbi:MAG: ABC transporter substrate-binding protein [Pseudomonadota bacterium]
MTRIARRLLLAATAAGALAPFFAPAAADDGAALIGADWSEVVAAARGGEVNWYLWGGADEINRYVSDYVGAVLKDRYGITLNRIGLSDTAEAVNLVLSETQAGVREEGSVDLVWINGENFRTMKQGGLVFCGYPDTLPNNRYVDWSDPSIANDFGVPVEGCEIPWTRAQFAFGHDAAETPEPPRSIPEIIAWAKANPGRFAYPAPPDFNGSVFVRHVFYHAAGDVERLLGPFDQAVFDEVAAKTWAILNELEPYLWREGVTYPTSITQLEQLFANREVAFYFNYDPTRFGLGVRNGTFPDTVRSYGLTEGTIGNTSYTLIPANAANKAAAMVLQNLLLSPEAQLEKAKPDVWGAPPSIDVARASAEMQAAFAALDRHPAVVAPEELAKAALPELQADWITAIEKGWREHVGR